MTSVVEDGNLGVIGKLANIVGAPEPALRLLLTVLAGYPIAAIYRKYLISYESHKCQHIFFFLSGFFLYIFNYGYDVSHSLFCTCFTYILVLLRRDSPTQLIVINFIFNMSYLLIGYYFTESGDYDILWTMPHCVLALRLIGYGFDITDGCKKSEELSKEQRENGLKEVPSFWEHMAYAYFPCSFLVGPQFPFRRYQRFVSGEFRQYKGAIRSGLNRFMIGMLYLVIRQIGSVFIPDDYFFSPEFRNSSFICRLIYLGLWGKFSLYKYISCWLLTEGALMCLGFSFNGINDKGEVDWSGCSNVKLKLFETGTAMQHYVHSFNVNTNQWVAQYIYKRLKFLNNRTISYAASLSFLAVWHGFHSGYYMAFLNEYMIVTIEKQIETMYKHYIVPTRIETYLYYRYIKFFTQKTYNTIYMGWCLVPFSFMKYDRWHSIFATVNYFGFVYLIFWYILYKIYKTVSRPVQSNGTSESVNNAASTSVDNKRDKTE